MKPMSFWNYCVGGFFISLGTAVILLSQKFPIEFGTGDPGSGFWPVSLGVMMISLSVILVIQSVLSTEIKNKMLSLNEKSNIKVYIIMSLSVLFCVLVYLTGFFVASFVFIYTVMGVMEVRNPKERIITAFSINLVLYLIFTALLKTRLPLPIFLR